MTEIQLPHSAKAERALLGALLINPEELSQIDLMPSDFYDKNNGAIYSAMIALDLQGVSVDVISVMNALQSMNKLDEVGGFDYLAGLANDVPSSLNAQTYADIVKDKSNRRKIIIKSQTLAQAAFDESKDVLEAVSETVESLVSNVNIGEGAKPISHILNQLFDEVSNAMANPKEIYGMATGMPTFDKITRGLQKKEVAILAGEPGAGKSALAVQLGVGMAKGASGQNPHPGVIYELEMSALATVRRVIAYESRVQAYKLRSGKLEDDDVERFTQTTEQADRKRTGQLVPLRCDFVHRPGRIPNDGLARCDIFRDDCPHAYHCAFANDQWFSRQALLDDGASADIGMIFDDDVSVAAHIRRECNEVAYDAVMRNIRIDVAMKIPSNFCVCSNA